MEPRSWPSESPSAHHSFLFPKRFFRLSFSSSKPTLLSKQKALELSCNSMHESFVLVKNNARSFNATRNQSDSCLSPVPSSRRRFDLRRAVMMAASLAADPTALGTPHSGFAIVFGISASASPPTARDQGRSYVSARSISYVSARSLSLLTSPRLHSTTRLHLSVTCVVHARALRWPR